MEAQSLHRQLANFAQHKQTMISQLEQCQQWLDKHHIANSECKSTLERALAKLKKSSFTLACTGDFSKGKSELINALMMTGSLLQVLPSEPGRTIECPTEIFFDPDSHPNSLRLLPIETRRTGVSLSKFKDNQQLWLKLPFDLTDVSTTQHILSQLTRTKAVTADTAKRLGFDPANLVASKKRPEHWEIPAWRYAQINIDLPLLRLGLRIQDIPGLKIFDCEPELTLDSLSGADTILFLLAADQPFSRNDKLIWKKHLREQAAPVVTLLNKADTLWDVTHSSDSFNKKLMSLRQAVAQGFKQPLEHVLGLSAKMALAAHISGDPLMRYKSKLPELESLLVKQLKYSQQRLSNHRLIGDAVAVMQSSHQQLKGQMFNADAELELLQKKHQQPQRIEQSIGEMLLNKRQQYSLIKRQELDLRAQQARLGKLAEAMQRPYSEEVLTPILKHCQQRLLNSKNIMELNRSLAVSFIQLQSQLDKVDQQATLANNLLANNYSGTGRSQTTLAAFHHAFDLTHRRVQLLKLQTRARLFLTAYSQQQNAKHPMIRRLIHALLQTIRANASSLTIDINDWLTEAMAPLRHQTQYQKSLTEQQVLQLTNINQQPVAERDPMPPLRGLISRHEDALFDLDRIIKQLQVTPLIGRGAKIGRNGSLMPQQA